jgi:hypothetical protein
MAFTGHLCHGDRKTAGTCASFTQTHRHTQTHRERETQTKPRAHRKEGRGIHRGRGDNIERAGWEIFEDVICVTLGVVLESGGVARTSCGTSTRGTRGPKHLRRGGRGNCLHGPLLLIFENLQLLASDAVVFLQRAGNVFECKHHLAIIDQRAFRGGIIGLARPSLENLLADGHNDDHSSRASNRQEGELATRQREAQRHRFLSR